MSPNILLDKALQYANYVVDGKEITTQEVISQCKVFLNDYNNRQYKEEFDYYFDEDKLLVINNLLKLLNFATGFVENQCVLESLANFQAFLIANVFGWRYKSNSKRFRYRDVNLFIARKNAKSSIVGIIFILLLLTEQQYSEFYSICLTKELAGELKKAMEQVINASPLISKHFKISASQTGRITCKITGSFFEPRVSESGKNNSIRPSAFVGDEYGNFKEISNFNAMRSGQKSVLNPIAFKTTTAYAINNSIMETEDLPYIRSVLNGSIEDERTFSLIYYSEKEHLFDDIGMYQASPLRIEQNYEEVRNNRKQAKEKPSAMSEYLTKDMNVFVQENAGESYMDLDKYKACVVDEAPIDIKGKTLFIGIDLAKHGDLCGVTFQIPFVRESDNLVCQYIENYSFLPNNEVLENHIKTDKVPYDVWKRQGYVFTTDSEITDQKYILDFCFKKIEEIKPEKVMWCIDPHNASMFTTTLLDMKQEVFQIYQSAKHIGEATNGLRSLTYEGRIYYLKNPCFLYQLGNAYIKVDEDGWIKIDKKSKNKTRIDNVDSTINSNKLAMYWKPKVSLKDKILSGAYR